MLSRSLSVATPMLGCSCVLHQSTVVQLMHVEQARNLFHGRGFFLFLPPPELCPGQTLHQKGHDNHHPDVLGRRHGKGLPCCQPCTALSLVPGLCTECKAGSDNGHFTFVVAEHHRSARAWDRRSLEVFQQRKCHHQNSPLVFLDMKGLLRPVQQCSPGSGGCKLSFKPSLSRF